LSFIRISITLHRIIIFPVKLPDEDDDDDDYEDEDDEDYYYYVAY
jgi:hypothetical protein